MVDRPLDSEILPGGEPLVGTGRPDQRDKLSPEPLPAPEFDFPVARAGYQLSLVQEAHNRLYPNNTNFRQFTPDELLLAGTDTNLLDSLNASAYQSGIVQGILRNAKDIAARNRFAPDPEWDLSDHYDADEAFRKQMDYYLQNAADEDNENLLNKVGKAESLEEAQYFLAEAEKNRINAAQARKYGIVPQLVGTAPTLIMDAVAGILAAPAVVGMAPEALITLLNTNKLAAFGAAAGSASGAGVAEVLLHKNVDQTFTNTDVALAAGIGLLVGGTVGGLVARRIGKNAKALDLDENMSVVDPDGLTGVRNAPGKAAGVGDLKGSKADRSTVGSNLPDPKVGGTVITDRLMGTSSLTGLGVRQKIGKYIARSLKVRTLDRGARGAREAAGEHKLKGNAHSHEQMGKLIKYTQATADELQGKGVRNVTAQQVRQATEDEAHRVFQRNGDIFKDTIQKMFGVKWGTSANWNSSVIGQQIGKRRFAGLDPQSVELYGYRLWKREKEIAYRAENPDVAAKWRVPDEDDMLPMEIREQLSDEQMLTLKEGARKMGENNGGFYDRMFRKELDAGILTEDDGIRDYGTAQLWARETIKAKETEFTQRILQSWGEAPDVQWVREAMPERLGPDGEVIFDGIRPDETLAEFAKRAPGAYDQVSDAWYRGIERKFKDGLKKHESMLKKELAKFDAKSLDELEARLDKSVGGKREQVEKLEAEFGKMERKRKVTPEVEIWRKKGGREEAALKIERLHKEIYNAEKRLDRVRELDVNVKEDLTWLRRQTDKATKAARKDIASKVTDVEKQSAKWEEGAYQWADQRVKEFTQQLFGAEAHFAAVPDGWKLNSGRFMRRSIHLGELEFDPTFDKFRNLNMDTNRRVYARGVGGQLGVREAFKEVPLKPNGALDRAAIHRKYTEGYRADLERADLPPKVRKQIEADMKEAEEELDTILSEILGDYENRAGVMDEIAGGALAAMAAMTLGKVLIASIGDLATTILAGSKAATGLRSMFKRIDPHIRDMVAGGDDRVSLAIQGASINGQGRFNSLIQDSDRLLEAPGSSWRVVKRLLSDVAAAEGTFSFLKSWTQHVRQSFGMDAAIDFHNHIVRDGWSSLNPKQKTFYARHGVGEKEFKALKAQYKKGTRSYAGGKLLIPDERAWDEEYFDLWLRLLNGAGEEAVLHPSIGDRAILGYSPIGKIITQFQAYGFALAEKFGAKISQDLRHNPADGQALAAAAFSLLIGNFVQGTHEHINGRGGEWRNRWTTAEGAYQNFLGGMMRGPLGMGGLPMMYEALVKLPAVQAAGEGIGEVTGFNPAPKVSRFMQQQGFFGALGPLAGFLNSMYQKSDDPDKMFDLAMKRAPIINTILPHLAYQAYLGKLWE